MRLFTCAWIPKESSRGVVCLCHGYAVECSVTMRGTAERLARAGYAVYGIDYEGHGHSDGLQGYVPDLDALDMLCFLLHMSSLPPACLTVSYMLYGLFLLVSDHTASSSLLMTMLASALIANKLLVLHSYTNG
uniref:Serine aminopeptidase S33 domain-containing protein n=1 Tax=Oryza nivara TaxID=4536 RepID=A0A0E0HWS6_ORYNI